MLLFFNVKLEDTVGAIIARIGLYLSYIVSSFLKTGQKVQNKRKCNWMNYRTSCVVFFLHLSLSTPKLRL